MCVGAFAQDADGCGGGCVGPYTCRGPLSRCLAGGVIYLLSRCLSGGVIYIEDENESVIPGPFYKCDVT